MKKVLFILLMTPLFLFSQNSIGTTDDIKISENLETNWTGISYKKRIEISTNSIATNFDVAEKGFKLLELAIRIKNTSKTTIDVDVSKFQLVDENSNIYNANLCQDNNLNKKDCDNFDFNIKSNKKRIVLIYFSPQIPESSSIKFIRYNGVDIYEFD